MNQSRAAPQATAAPERDDNRIPDIYPGSMLRSQSATALALMSAGILTLTACSGDETVAAPPLTASSTAPASPSAAVDDPPGSIACHLLASDVRNATLMNPGAVATVVTASATADAPVADAARRLATAYATALAAKDTENEPDAIAAVSAAGADMSAICADSGLDTVG